jgi:parallel beta-helix repeat protein
VPAVLQVGAHQPYLTITSALQVAQPGDTVRVHPGTYQEAVHIAQNNLTLEGVNLGAVIEAPANLASNGFSIVEVDGVSGVTVRNLTVEGPYTGTFTQVGDDLLGLHVGIFVSHGGSATIAGNHVTDIRDDPPNTTSDDGVGILAGSRTNVLDTTGSAVIENNTIDNYQRVGIDVANAGSSATIRHNTVTGLNLSLANQYPVQVGIAIEENATAVITRNTVSNNIQTAPNSFPFGIYLYGSGAGVSVNRNTVDGNSWGILAYLSQEAAISDNDVSGNINDGIDLESTLGPTTLRRNTVNANGGQGVYVVNAPQVTLRHNTMHGNGSNGIGIFGSTGATVVGNTASDNGADGIFADSASTGNVFDHNTMTGNSLFDAEDDSTGILTAGTANTWDRNNGKTDNKGGGLLK